MQLRFILDEDVDVEVGAFLEKRGHWTKRIDELVGYNGATDQVIAATADQQRAIVVTWNNKDFQSINKRDATRKTAGPQRVGIVTFYRLKQTRGLERIAAVIDFIESEAARVIAEDDPRLFIEIGGRWTKVWR